MSLDDLSRIRKRCDDIHTALAARYPIASPADWFEQADSNATWHIAFSYACLPTIGEDISACLSIFATSASVAWQHRWGMIPKPEMEIDAHEVGFASGHLAVATEHVAALNSAARTFWKVGGAVLPQECYDGTPVSLAVTAHPFDETKTGACNICDRGRHSTRRLARLAVNLIGCSPGCTT